jgi:hypothetical protein
MDVNEALLSLWRQKYPADANVLVPIAHRAPNRRGVVVAGFNPSFSVKPGGWPKILKKWKGPPLDPVAFFDWRNLSSYDLKTSIELETLARECLPFYDYHRQLASIVGLPWDHLDLFAMRHRDQKTAKDAVWRDDALTAFGKEQFRIFENLLAAAAPAVVIVANADASRIYRANRRPEFEGANGCHFDAIAGERTPVFFSAMFSGGALDEFSRERLFWHVARVLGKEWPVV